jgi:hypothetical protein
MAEKTKIIETAKRGKSHQKKYFFKKSCLQKLTNKVVGFGSLRSTEIIRPSSPAEMKV